MKIKLMSIKKLKLLLNENIYNFKMKEDEVDNIFQVFEAIMSKKKDKYEHCLNKISTETKEQFQYLNKKYKYFK